MRFFPAKNPVDARREVVIVHNGSSYRTYCTSRKVNNIVSIEIHVEERRYVCTYVVTAQFSA